MRVQLPELLRVRYVAKSEPAPGRFESARFVLGEGDCLANGSRLLLFQVRRVRKGCPEAEEADNIEEGEQRNADHCRHIRREQAWADLQSQKDRDSEVRYSAEANTATPEHALEEQHRIGAGECSHVGGDARGAEGNIELHDVCARSVVLIEGAEDTLDAQFLVSARAAVRTDVGEAKTFSSTATTSGFAGCGADDILIIVW